MRNIELKVRHPDLSQARAAARTLGARHTWTRTQRDTYFAIPDARLKVREMPDSAELIWYARPDGVRPRPSTYSIVPLRDARAACALLLQIWGPAGVVEKTRELWLWRNVRIHLDDVTSLGTFVELEGVIDGTTGEHRTRERVSRVIAALGLDQCRAVPQSYRDLGAARADSGLVTRSSSA